MYETKTTIEELLHTPIGEVAKYNVAKLYDLQQEARSNFEDARKIREWIDSAISIKYEEHIRAKRLRADKDSGVIHIEDDSFKITNNVTKKVEWNQRTLQKIIADLLVKGADMDAIVDTIYHIPERRFCEFTGSLQQLLAPARIIRHSKEQYKLTKSDNAEVYYG